MSTIGYILLDYTKEELGESGTEMLESARKFFAFPNQCAYTDRLCERVEELGKGYKLPPHTWDLYTLDEKQKEFDNAIQKITKSFKK